MLSTYSYIPVATETGLEVYRPFNQASGGREERRFVVREQKEGQTAFGCLNKRYIWLRSILGSFFWPQYVKQMD